MTDFSSARKWWPAFLSDESMPEGRDKPEKWLDPDDAGVTTIHWGDERASIAWTISPGETVKFVWHEDRGKADIAVMPDGTWSLIGADDPDAVGSANWFAEYDYEEDNFRSMDDLASNWAEQHKVDPEGETITVLMGYWSDSISFTVSADGRALTGGDHG